MHLLRSSRFSLFFRESIFRKYQFPFKRNTCRKATSIFTNTYLNTNRIANVDLYRRSIGLDVIARFVSQFVSSKFSIDRGLRRWRPNQTQTCATRAQTFTYKLWSTTWTYGRKKVFEEQIPKEPFLYVYQTLCSWIGINLHT